MSPDEIVTRVRLHWKLKIALSVLLTIGFPAVYFGLLQRFPKFHVTKMNESWLDCMIPCVPDSVYLYESIWLLMPIAPWLMKTRDQLLRYCTAFAAMSTFGFCIFYFFPTAIPRPDNVANTNALYDALMQLDNGLNACPSFHAAFAVFHATCCHVIFASGVWDRCIRWAIWIWVAGILVSTLLTKQHVIVDLIAGTALGFGGFALFRYRPHEPPEKWRETS